MVQFLPLLYFIIWLSWLLYYIFQFENLKYNVYFFVVPRSTNHPLKKKKKKTNSLGRKIWICIILIKRNKLCHWVTKIWIQIIIFKRVILRAQPLTCFVRNRITLFSYEFITDTTLTIQQSQEVILIVKKV